MDKLIVNILKDIFGEAQASCYLEPLNMEDGQVYEESMNKILVFKRTYKQKFAVNIPNPKTSHKAKKVIVRKRRWKSPKPWSRPFKRRWVENGK